MTAQARVPYREAPEGYKIKRLEVAPWLKTMIGMTMMQMATTVTMRETGTTTNSKSPARTLSESLFFCSDFSLFSLFSGKMIISVLQ